MRTTSGLNLLSINELESGSTYIKFKTHDQRQQRHLMRRIKEKQLVFSFEFLLFLSPRAFT